MIIIKRININNEINGTIQGRCKLFYQEKRLIFILNYFIDCLKDLWNIITSKKTIIQLSLYNNIVNR